MIRGRLHHLSAIKERQTFDKGELIRPLLSFYKKDFPEIEHFEDSTNKENHYLHQSYSQPLSATVRKRKCSR